MKIAIESPNELTGTDLENIVGTVNKDVLLFRYI